MPQKGYARLTRTHHFTSIFHYLRDTSQRVLNWCQSALLHQERIVPLASLNGPRLSQNPQAGSLEAPPIRGRLQLPACDKCTQGVMDTHNSHWQGTCHCTCHTTKTANDRE